MVQDHARAVRRDQSALLDAAEVPDCATSARDEAKTYIEGLTSSSEDLLGDDSASPDDINAVVQQATEGSAPLLEALSSACA